MRTRGYTLSVLISDTANEAEDRRSVYNLITLGKKTRGRTSSERDGRKNNVARVSRRFSTRIFRLEHDGVHAAEHEDCDSRNNAAEIFVLVHGYYSP